VLRSGASQGGAEPQENSCYSLTQIANASDVAVQEVLTSNGFSGAIEAVRKPLTKTLLDRLRKI
jgi:hypothetical protein